MQRSTITHSTAGRGATKLVVPGTGIAITRDAAVHIGRILEAQGQSVNAQSVAAYYRSRQ